MLPASVHIVFLLPIKDLRYFPCNYSKNDCPLARSFQYGWHFGKMCNKCIPLEICSCLMYGCTIITVRGDLGQGESCAVYRGFGSVESWIMGLPWSGNSTFGFQKMVGDREDVSECQCELFSFTPYSSLPGSWSQGINMNRIFWQPWRVGSFSLGESVRTESW